MDQENSIIKKYLENVYQSLGKPIEITFKNGDTAVGVFAGFSHITLDLLVYNFCLKKSEKMEAKRVVKFAEMDFFLIKNMQNLENVNSLKFQKKELVLDKSKSKNENKKKLDLTRQVSRGIKNDVFRLDTEISKKTMETREGKKENITKVFKKFQASESYKSELLENEKLENFDQFTANKIQFGIDSKFNESDYTTYLDMKEFKKEDIERANRLADEIMNSSVPGIAPTRHQLEERNLIDLQDNDNEDEEALYSAVVREDVKIVKPAFILKPSKNLRKDSLRVLINKNFLKSKLAVKESQAPEIGLIKNLSKDTGLLGQLANNQPQTQFYSQYPTQIYPQQMYYPVNGYLHPTTPYYTQPNGYGYIPNNGYPPNQIYPK